MSANKNDNPLASTAAVTDRPAKERAGFSEDFRRFFLRGLATVLPTLITLWLFIKVWDFLWENVGRYILWGIKWLWVNTAGWWLVPNEPPIYIRWFWREDLFRNRLVGVLLAIVLIYIVGWLVGNFIGRTLWRVIEDALMRIPLIRAIYPPIKQVTDFLLAEKKRHQPFEGSRVVAVQPHEKGIWSIGLVTGPGLQPLTEHVGQEMVTVFIPSSPTAFSGYVLVVPRESVVELPLKVEEAMRLLISGGVLTPIATPTATTTSDPATAPVLDSPKSSTTLPATSP